MITIFDEKEWETANKLYLQDSIKDEILKRIREQKMELPYNKSTLAEADKYFHELQEYITDFDWKHGDFYLKYNYKYPHGDAYVDSAYIGNRASNYFHQISRMKCDSLNSPSPYRVWNTDKFMKTLFGALWTMKVKEVTDETLWTSIVLRKYVASQFKPTVAKAIYRRYDSKNVLDFSMGWGDRLAGFYASPKTERYVGTDPNIDLQDGYREQVKLYGISTSKEVIIRDKPAEEMIYETEEFDTIFTSPPYFDTERYSTMDTQSWVRYKTLDEWLKKFLFESIERAWVALKRDGVMLLNLSDVYGHHQIQRICDPMNEFIEGLDGAEYEDCIGMRMAKRPNQNTHKSGVYCEPIWVWRKK
ncbi:MAG: hypothetical protein V3V41_08065 [Candidatus Heimdallarchaeota archaeon]